MEKMRRSTCERVASELTLKLKVCLIDEGENVALRECRTYCNIARGHSYYQSGYMFKIASLQVLSPNDGQGARSADLTVT